MNRQLNQTQTGNPVSLKSVMLWALSAYVFAFIIIGFAPSTSHANEFTAGPCGVSIATNMPPKMKNDLIANLTTIQNMRGHEDGSPLHLRIFGGPMSGETYCRLIAKRVRYIGVSPQVTSKGVLSCNKIDAACNIQGRVFLNPDIYPNLPFINRMSLLIHEPLHSHPESRQNDMSSQHTQCPARISTVFADWNSRWAGTYSCDQQLGGAYSAEIVWLRNIAMLCSNCPDRLRLAAQNLAANMEAEKITSRSSQDIIRMDYRNTPTDGVITYVSDSYLGKLADYAARITDCASVDRMTRGFKDLQIFWGDRLTTMQHRVVSESLKTLSSRAECSPGTEAPPQ